MDQPHPKPDNLDRVFEVAMILKGLNGLLEIVGGVILLFISAQSIQRFADWATSSTLANDPHEFFALHLATWAHGLSVSSITFGALYLLSHGIVKIVLVAAVLKEKLWAYPWMIGFLVLFIIYQLYRLAHEVTWGMSLLTIFDIFVVYLTVLEYRKHLARTPVKSE